MNDVIGCQRRLVQRRRLSLDRLDRDSRGLHDRPLPFTAWVSSVARSCHRTNCMTPAVAEVRRIGPGMDTHGRGELDSAAAPLRPDRHLVRERVDALIGGEHRGWASRIARAAWMRAAWVRAWG